jgi:hypothetical protein
MKGFGDDVHSASRNGDGLGSGLA